MKFKAGVKADLENVAGAFNAKPEVADFFGNPCVGASEKMSALSAVAGEAGMAQTTVGLFEVRFSFLFRRPKNLSGSLRKQPNEPLRRSRRGLRPNPPGRGW